MKALVHRIKQIEGAGRLGRHVFSRKTLERLLHERGDATFPRVGA
jgi:hypothetical protein